MKKLLLYTFGIILLILLITYISGYINVKINDSNKDFSNYSEKNLSELFTTITLNESVKVKGKIIPGIFVKNTLCGNKLHLKDGKYTVVIQDNQGNYFSNIFYIGHEVYVVVDNPINMLVCEALICECEHHLSFKDIKMI